MSINEQRRALFEEKAFAQRFISSVSLNDGQFGLQSVGCPTKAEFVAKDADGNYLDSGLNFAWWGWNKALDSSVIVLPHPVEPEQPDDAVDDSWLDGHNGAKRYRKTCVAAIEAAGLMVKP